MDAQYITIPADFGNDNIGEFHFNVKCTKEFVWEPDEQFIGVLNYGGELIKFPISVTSNLEIRNEDYVDVLNTLLIEAKLRPGNHYFGEVSNTPIYVDFS